jgi:hypothetical protein
MTDIDYTIREASYDSDGFIRSVMYQGDSVCLFRQSDRAQIREKGKRYTFCADAVYAIKMEYSFQIEGQNKFIFNPGDYIVCDVASGAIFGLSANTFETYAKDTA